MESNKPTTKKILILVFLSSLIVFAVFNTPNILNFIAKLYSFVSPVIAAFCIAFVFNVLLKGLENRIFKFMDNTKSNFIKKAKRPLCLVLTYVLALGIISLLVLVIIPDIIDTILYLVKNLPDFIKDARESVVAFAANFNIPESKIPNINLDFEAISKALQKVFQISSNKIVDGAINVTSSVIRGIYNAIFSIVISIYILAQKERIGRFVKKLIDTFLPQKTAKKIYHIATLASESFARFIGGQLIESTILGVLCYIGMIIFRFPNAAIVSVLIGVTSLIPVIGAFTGILIGFLLIIITSPIKALLFVLFVLILQQIEGNLIYPRVVGKAVGLPGIIVISAVLVGGNIGGIMGALLGVPLSALIFALLKEAVGEPQKPRKLKKANKKAASQ